MIVGETLTYSIFPVVIAHTTKIMPPILFAGASIILFIRNIFGGLILIAISLLFEKNTGPIQSIKTNLPLILLSGIIIYHFSKLMWYEGIKRIDVTKATSISLGASPILSIIFSIILLKEIPTIFQIIGFVLILIGIFTITFKNKNAFLNP